MIQLAFYKGTLQENPDHARWMDRLICWWTAGRFSHVEFVASWPDAPLATCWAASNRDGCVRDTFIDLGNGRWEVVTVEAWNYFQVLEYFRTRKGVRYGWLCAAAHAVPRPIRPLLRWAGHYLPYCSYIIAAAGGAVDPWLTPQGLYEHVTEKKE